MKTKLLIISGVLLLAGTVMTLRCIKKTHVDSHEEKCGESCGLKEDNN